LNIDWFGVFQSAVCPHYIRAAWTMANNVVHGIASFVCKPVIEFLI
jgi:hypothetical protein